MFRKNTLFDYHWDVDKYKNNFDPEHWDLCRSFMVIHRTKFPEQKLAHLTEAFYQIGVYGSSYDPKTTRMVSALSVEVLDDFLNSHPGAMRHPFRKTIVASKVADETLDESSKKDSDKAKSGSIWDVTVDKSIIANVLVQSQMQSLLKGFIIIYDVTRESTMNDSKVGILEESFRRSKFGPCHWDKDETHNNLCPIRLSLKWKGTVLAEGEGSDDKTLRTRLAQAVLSKLSTFSHGIETKWSYYRDGRKPGLFDHMKPRRSEIYKSIPRSQFKAMEEITSYIDTFANSDSFTEIIFAMDFSNNEKAQLTEYITKSWGTRLTYRTVNKEGVKSKCETHLCIYHNRTGEELKRWLDKFGGENERYRLVPPGEHRRAGGCDNNVREVLTIDTDGVAGKITGDDIINTTPSQETSVEKNEESDKIGQKETVESDMVGEKKQEHEKKKGEEVIEGDLEKLLDGFVLFYNAKRNSEIDKDDWFSALCDSFKMSKFGPLEVINKNIRPLRTTCILKWKDKILASAEGLTETQAKTAATLQLISKLEPFTYIIQAKEEYFFGGKVPPFIENPDPDKSDVYRVVRRKDLLSYYSIFQTIDEFTKIESHGEIVFGADFSWELKNEIVVYLKAKGLDYRYFTVNDQNPWTHMAVYHSIQPENLKDYLLKNGGESEKFKLISPQRVEPDSNKTVELETPKVPEIIAEKPPAKKVAEKRKLPPKEPTPLEEDEGNKIQINLKKFKKDKVEYPEDTGGDFPGLILWIGIRKNSIWQKNLFCIMIESFKMSKYGDLIVEESEESVWGRKEPFKKCVIKANRKVLAVGLGESKTEAKNSAAMQVLRQLRKHCYTIQAKLSYFKDGKATPYDFNPDPAKAHVYCVVRRNAFIDRAAIIKYIDDFSQKVCDEEIIFGDDFTFDEREAILSHCRQIRLMYRLIKCQSMGKGLHTHVAVYHQKPPPVIKAALMEAGGEDDKYRLIPPGGKITYQVDEKDMWPETLEDGKGGETVVENIGVSTVYNNDQSTLYQSNSGLHSSTSYLANGIGSDKELPEESPVDIANGTLTLDFNAKDSEIDNFSPTVHLIDNNEPTGKNISVKLSGRDSKSTSQSDLYNPSETRQDVVNHSQPISYSGMTGPHPQPMDYNVGAQQFHYGASMGPHPQPVDYMYPQPQPGNFVPFYPQGMLGPAIQEMSFGPPPLYIPPPLPMHGDLQEMPLQFGPQPSSMVQSQMQTTNLSIQENLPVPPGLTPFDVYQSREISNKEPATSQRDSRDELTHQKRSDSQDLAKDDSRKKTSDEKTAHKTSPGKSHRRESLRGGNRKESPVGNRAGRGLRRSPVRRDFRFSSERDRRRISPRRRSFSPERRRSPDRMRERRSFRSRESPVRERCSEFSRDRQDDYHRQRRRSISRSPRRSPLPYRDKMHVQRSISPTPYFRDLWQNIGGLGMNIVMFRYVRRNSKVETDPIALLNATRALDFAIDFDFIVEQISIDEWGVSVYLMTDTGRPQILVGEGRGVTAQEARMRAAHHAVDTVQKACYVIEPNYRYFAEGDVPEFISRKYPLKTHIYEIIQNLDHSKSLNRSTVHLIMRMFRSSDLEDIFFLATDFSYRERALVIEVADELELWWRLFGSRELEVPEDDISMQHICVYKERDALSLVHQLQENGGSNLKYTLLDPRESRITDRHAARGSFTEEF